MRFQCPCCQKWPPMSNAAFCSYCGARFSDYKFEPAQLANNYRKFAIKYFWFIGLPGSLALAIVVSIVGTAIFGLDPDSESNPFMVLSWPVMMILAWAHFEWWYGRKFPNYHR